MLAGRRLYNRSSEALVRFGLGGETKVERLEIRWPSGILQTLENVPGGRVVDVEEPNGEPKGRRP